MTVRPVVKVVKGMATSDGAGVRMTRVLGTPEAQMFDPFLMLDHFNTENADDYIGGFPEHPHRGFETVTYMLEGKMRHGDNTGREGVIQTGGKGASGCKGFRNAARHWSNRPHLRGCFALAICPVSCSRIA